MKKSRKEFTFDLKVEKLKKEFGEKNYSKGYDQLKEFFCKKLGFEHRQGSVYCSTQSMYSHEVFDVVENLKVSCPWLKDCLTRMDVADVGNIHELTDYIKKEKKKENVQGKNKTMNMDGWKGAVEKPRNFIKTMDQEKQIGNLRDMEERE